MNPNPTPTSTRIRPFLRVLAVVLLGTQIAVAVLLLTEGKMAEASSPFALCVWMTLALLYESKAHALAEQSANLQEFLDHPEGKVPQYKSNKSSRF